jgi:hypothetical protein
LEGDLEWNEKKREKPGRERIWNLKGKRRGKGSRKGIRKESGKGIVGRREGRVKGKVKERWKGRVKGIERGLRREGARKVKVWKGGSFKGNVQRDLRGV